MAGVGEGEAHEAVMAACHLPLDTVADGFVRSEPDEIECFLRRLAVTVDRHDVGEAASVLAGIVKSDDSGVRERVRAGARRRRGRQSWESARARDRPGQA